jgi:hypothetical protein
LRKALNAGRVPHGTLVIAAGPPVMLEEMKSLALESSPAGGAVPVGPSIEVLTNV